MVGHKVKMELIVNEKSRYRIFQNRQKGLKKKIHELSTLCDVKACMILYGPNAHGTESSQPDIWPENRNEVEGIIENYRKERKEDHGKRTLDLSDVLQTKKTTDLELRELQEKNVKTKTGVDEFSYEQLLDILDKLDKKHEAVQNMIDSRKEKARLMSETTVGCSNMQGLSAEKTLNIKVPMDCQGTGVVESDMGFMMNQMGMMTVENHQNAELGAGRASSSDIQYNNVQYHDPIHYHPALGVEESDMGFMMNQMGMMTVENHQYAELGAGRASSSDIQYTNVQYHDPIHYHPALGVEESDMGFMMNQMGMMTMENHQYAEFGAGRASSSDIQCNNVQYHDPIHYHPALGVPKNVVLNPDPTTPTHQMGVSKNMVFMVDNGIPMQHMPTFMQYPMMSTDLGTDPMPTFMQYPLMSTDLGTDSNFWYV